MTSIRTVPADTPQKNDPRRKWSALAFIVIAQLMVVLDGTIVNIALPAAQTDLQFDDAHRQWVVTAYVLAFGSLLPLGGRLIGLFGQKRAFITGVVGFGLASALGGFAPSLAFLIAARIAQGVFAALLAPAGLSLITTMFVDAKERVRAFGVFGAVSTAGGALGMLLGGVLTEFLSWRWCMFVNTIFAAVALIGGAILIIRDVSSVRARFDMGGFLTSTAGIVAVVYGFARSEEAGWTDPVTLGCLLGGAVLIVAFVLVEQRAADPILPLRVVLDRDRGGALLATMMTNIGLFSMFFFLPFYLQRTLEFSALMTGVAFVPFPLAVIVSSTLVAGRLIPRFGSRTVIMLGGFIAAVGILILQAMRTDSDYAVIVLPALIIMGFGAGLVYTTATAAATHRIRPEDSGAASAAVNMAQQIGGSVGTALLSSIYGGAVTAYLTSHAASEGVESLAEIHGYHVAFGVGCVVLVGVVVLSRLLLRGRNEEQADVAAE